VRKIVSGAEMWGLPKHRKSPQIRPQITAIHRKSGSSDFNDATTDRKSV